MHSSIAAGRDPLVLLPGRAHRLVFCGRWSSRRGFLPNTPEVRSLLVREAERPAEFLLRRARQFLGPGQQERHDHPDERVRGDPLPLAPAAPVQRPGEDRQASDLVRPDQQFLALQAQVLRAGPESSAGACGAGAAAGGCAAAGRELPAPGVCTRSGLCTSGVCSSGVCASAGDGAGRRDGMGGGAAGRGLQRGQGAALGRRSRRRPLGQAAELDEQLDLDAADVVHRGTPRTVTAVGGHRHAVELGLRVRDVPADEAGEVGEAEAVEQLAQLLDRRGPAQRVTMLIRSLYGRPWAAMICAVRWVGAIAARSGIVGMIPKSLAARTSPITGVSSRLPGRSMSTVSTPRTSRIERSSAGERAGRTWNGSGPPRQSPWRSAAGRRRTRSTCRSCPRWRPPDRARWSSCRRRLSGWRGQDPRAGAGYLSHGAMLQTPDLRSL